MPDTQRTLAALQALLADNTVGDISAQDIRDFLVSAMMWDFTIVAAADKDVTSNTTIADDGELQFDVAANGVYYFELLLVHSSPVGGTTPDLKFAFAGPATLTGQWSTDLYLTAADAQGSVSQQNLTTAGTYGTATTPRVARIFGWCSSTGGGTGASGFRFQWSQNTSSANATRRLAGSLLRYKRLV